VSNEPSLFKIGKLLSSARFIPCFFWLLQGVKDPYPPSSHPNQMSWLKCRRLKRIQARSGYLKKSCSKRLGEV